MRRRATGGAARGETIFRLAGGEELPRCDGPLRRNRHVRPHHGGVNSERAQGDAAHSMAARRTSRQTLLPRDVRRGIRQQPGARCRGVGRLPRQLLILVPTQIIEVRGQKNKKA